MKNSIIILLLLPLLSFGQKDDLWYKYYVKENRRVGYKDASGKIMIQPNLGFFGMSVNADKFDKIMAVRENINKDSSDSYYLLKNGTKFGRDSLFMHEFDFACESEGHIKYEDRKKELVGLFNSKGKAVVPAEYSWITQVKNGLFVGLKGAIKKPLSDHEHEGECNHWVWDGGTSCLVDTFNTVLVENFEYNSGIDFYSLKISESKIQEIGRVNFKGKDGLYYSFIDNKLLFQDYLDRLLDNLTLENLIENSFKEIVFSEKRYLTSSPKEKYIKENFEAISNKLKTLKREDCKYHFSLTTFISLSENLKFILDDKRDNCGNLNLTKYPIMVLRIDQKGKRQRSITFVKFENDFEIINF